MAMLRDAKGRFLCRDGEKKAACKPKHRHAETAQKRGADMLDAMHAKAKQGAKLGRMREAFPSVNPDKLARWYEQNGYFERNYGASRQAAHSSQLQKEEKP